jgi:hypothetical protein
MVQPQQVRKWCEKKYPEFLRSLISGEPFFPLEIKLVHPRPGYDHDQLDREVKALAEASLGYHIEWTTRKFRLTGEQRIPARLWFEDAQEYLAAIQRTREVEQFCTNLNLIRRQCPGLLEWAARNPLKLVAAGAICPDLIKVCQYFLSNPNPGKYARELPISVPTKFIAENKAIIDSLLQELFPDATAERTEKSFEKRFGLRSEEPLIRFRLLDHTLLGDFGPVVEDASIPLSEALRFDWKKRLIVVVENKMTFLTLPLLPNAIGVWGAGNAAQLLTSMRWLHDCSLLYWGDIDVHGFHIVSRLRGTFPQVQTIMMDSHTLNQHAVFITKAKSTSHENVLMLTEKEYEAYMQVKDGELLLEQEKIPYDYAVKSFSAFINDSELRLEHNAIAAKL